MNENQNDTRRAITASKAILDSRHPHDRANHAAILVTLEHTVAAVLLALYGDPARAAAMMNEALVPGVEERLSFYANKVKRT